MSTDNSSFSEHKSIDGLVCSSKSLGWQGIIVEQRDQLGGEWCFPATSECLICLYLGQPLWLEQQRHGKLHQKSITRGHSMIVPSGEASIWRHYDSARHIHLRITSHLIGRVAQEMTDLEPNKIQIIERFGVEDLAIQHLGLALIEELKSGGVTGQLYVDSLAIALTTYLLKHHATKTIQTSYGGNGLSPRKLSQAIDYLHFHLSSDVSLAELAQTVGFSQSHFSNLFKQSTGKTPYQYLLQLRVERAKKLLAQSDSAIAEIATEVGFYDQSHLARHIRRITGVSPKRYRQQA